MIKRPVEKETMLSLEASKQHAGVNNKKTCGKGANVIVGSKQATCRLNSKKRLTG